ncbi:TlpA family protein disulfide reductase [Shewanella surugensis]|uniref:TlpA family protein disulfide reductase n=1 Tax=Shewanella surugensis TaxID=212020 RepID=A0ABT0LBG0_9GAMM|nr:TlpA disulfide reductase family protein [Shewanella surugensis]MCL1125043.1 TlpA family protein disulfide reductase [Shewanella surugensis]
MRKMKLTHSISVLVVALSITACSHSTGQLTTATHPAPAPIEAKYQTYVEVGQRVPVMQLTDIQGRQINLAQSKHKKLLILFATWCPDSQRAMKALVQSDLINAANIDIIGIGREETVLSLSQFAEEYHLPFSLVADKDKSLYRQFANAGIPRFILLDENNKIVKTLLLEDEAKEGELLAPIQW